MAVYLAYTISPILLAGLIIAITGRSVSGNPVNRKRYLWLCGITMTLMIGLRNYSNGSGDSYYYYRLWNAMSSRSLEQALVLIATLDMEKGFLVLVWLLSQFFQDGQWVFLLSGAFFSITICRFSDKYCENVVLPLLIFNCLGLFNFFVQGMRQAIAICICIFAIDACRDKKPIKFLLQVALAMIFHASAILFLPVYWLGRLKIKPLSIVTFIIICVAGLFVSTKILDIINLVMNENYSFGVGSSDGSGMVAILIYAVIICFGLLIALLCKGNISYSLYIYMAILGMTAMIMRNTAISIAERAGYYYMCSQMVIIPESLRRIKKGYARWGINVIVVLMCLGVAIHKASYSDLIPYRFFWQ